MKKLLACLLMVWLFSACDSFRTGGQFASGRRALLVKNYEEALGHFQKVADKRPGYVFESVNFREGVWTYLGRCQYHMGKLAEARHSLERAIGTNRDDYLASVFMGLTLARQGDNANGFREVEKGLKGLSDWIEYENSRDPSKSFWDPNLQIRKEIASVVEMISGRKPDAQKVIESTEWIGLKMENEVDQVRRDERRRDG
ncbi:MAG: tetratricopeptide repeat protein [Candidatus Binatia bacterium]